MEQRDGGLTADERQRAIDLIAAAQTGGKDITPKTAGKVDLIEAIGMRREEVVGSENAGIFLTPKNIKTVKRDFSRVVKSGIDMLDRYIIGFNLSEVSVWSGSNGSGKSSVLSQLALESIDSGFRVALYSGELLPDRVMNWIHLQAAGKNHVQGTKYNNFYTVDQGVRERINEWLEGGLYIYNNDFGSRVENVLKALGAHIDKYKLNVLIIDNMMTLNLSSIAGEQYARQTELITALTRLAKKKNVHIHFVCHPRKTLFFLRKNDIAGTADITNLADNVFIVHRVNTDFKRGVKELGIREDNPIMGYSNVIEICKNRDLGISDKLVGLFFEPESKRFLNTRDEVKNYGWEKDKDGFVSVVNMELPFD